ncbi:hypothetical protein MATL_G00244630 [Megalops atlanticus]|uniref:Rhodanese domain-containing protein n=1 Tax=Megalops atlanticus TaxID=7932 RepID=A0A9D3PAF8_MEGAT|nr:hypothetical protein MATL_G00244630 [Megalops atlanticus]
MWHHVLSAYSYPVATLSRTMDPYTKEVLEYKNVPGKIIIVYDEDERIASVAATTMCERGFENVFMLSGGLRVIAKKFPEGMTTGSLPTHFLRSAASHRSLLRGPLRHESRPAEVKWRFTSEDLRKIQQYQEEMLMPTASNSQVTLSSKSSSLSKSSSSRSQRVSSAAGTDSSRSQSSRPWR